MRRLILALLTTAILLGVAPASAQVLPVRVSLLMLTLIVQASDPASLLDFRFQYLDEYDREILVALRDYDQFRESSADVNEACFVLRAYGTESPVPQDCLNITRTNLHVQELGTASLFWFDGVINLQRTLTILDVNGFVGVCPAENPHCEFEYPHAPPGEAPPPPLLFDAADLDNREILVLIAEFERLNPEVNPLQPQGEWDRVLEDAIIEAGVNARVELLPQTFRSHDEARATADQYGATLIIWGYVGAAVVNSQYTVTPRWSRISAQPSETEVIGALDELALFVSPGGDVEYVFNFVIAQLAYFAEDYSAASDLLDRAIALAPAGRETEMGLAPIYFYWTYAQYMLGAPPESLLESLTRAIDLDQSMPAIYNNRANVYRTLDNLEAALEDYSQAIAIDPSYALAYYNRGLTFLDLHEYDRAISDLSEAITLGVSVVEAYAARGRAYRAIGDFERALNDFNEAIVLDPENPAYYNNRGNAYRSLGDHQNAIADFSTSIELAPQAALPYYNRALSYTDTGDYYRAITDFDQAIVLRPSYTSAHYGRGIAYYLLSELELAIVDFDQVIALDPSYAIAYYNRGLAYQILGELEQAIVDYDQAIALDPTHDAYYNRALAYDSLGDYEQAVADWSLAIALDPEDAHAYNNRGNAYSDLGEFERAIADYEQAIALDPNHARAYNNRGNAYYDLGDLTAAEEDYSRAIEIDPTYVSPYGGLVYVHADMEQCNKAADALRRYLELTGNVAYPGVEEYYRLQCGG